MGSTQLERLDVERPEELRRIALERTDWTRRAILGKAYPFNDVSVDCYVQGFCDAVAALNLLAARGEVTP